MKFLCILVVGLSITGIYAFPLTLLHTTQRQAVNRCGQLFNDLNPNNNDGEGGDSSSFDVDSARKQLENLLSDPSSLSKKSKAKGDDEFSLTQYLSSQDLVLPPPPPLSTIERDRRTSEIEILKELKDGDTATAKLWQLWYSERGSKAESLLQKADQLMGDPTSWVDCEKMLVALIEEHGPYFVEPVNRLATLYFLQGKYTDSYKLCRAILKVRPWHFGALSGIVQVCIEKGDREEARGWAQKRLPNIVSSTSFPPFSEVGPTNPRRAEWVETMVAKARDLLEAAEKNTKKSFGKPDNYFRRDSDSAALGMQQGDEDDGVWQ